MTLHEYLSGNVLSVIDLSSVTLLGLALLSLVPAFTSILTLIWIAIRVYETDTIQCLIHRRKCNHD